MKCQKKKEISNKKEKMQIKHFQNSEISELNQCQCQTMTTSDNVWIQVMLVSDKSDPYSFKKKIKKKWNLKKIKNKKKIKKNFFQDSKVS